MKITVRLDTDNKIYETSHEISDTLMKLIEESASFAEIINFMEKVSIDTFEKYIEDQD